MGPYKHQSTRRRFSHLHNGRPRLHFTLAAATTVTAPTVAIRWLARERRSTIPSHEAGNRSAWERKENYRNLVICTYRDPQGSRGRSHWEEEIVAHGVPF